jgi:hypothetical protein
MRTTAKCGQNRRTRRADHQAHPTSTSCCSHVAPRALLDHQSDTPLTRLAAQCDCRASRPSAAYHRGFWSTGSTYSDVSDTHETKSQQTTKGKKILFLQSQKELFVKWSRESHQKMRKHSEIRMSSNSHVAQLVKIEKRKKNSFFSVREKKSERKVFQSRHSLL